MSVTQAVPPRKQKPSAVDACEADSTSQISSKRDRYWDTLSKVWLTLRALQEFDRRTAVRDREQTHARDWTLWPRKRRPIDISRLTAASLRDLKRFARRGGPSLTDLRNCLGLPLPASKPMRAMRAFKSGAQGQSKSSNTPDSFHTGQAPKSSAYDRNFGQKCIDNHIYPDGYVCPDNHLPLAPENLDNILARLGRRRSSLSQSQFGGEAFRQFRLANAQAKDERDVSRNQLPPILGRNDRGYAPAEDVLFGNLEDMAPDVFKKIKPDLYYGARPEHIDRRVREQLKSHIVPSTNDQYPAAPNFFLEVKGPSGSTAVLTRQACYAGAMGARAMHTLQCYGLAEPTYDNMAYTFSATYHYGTLHIYSHHPTQPPRPGESPQYYTYQLDAFCLTGNINTFRQGVAALRNARDLAAEQRNMFIDQANTVARAQEQSGDTISFDDSNSQDTVTNLRRKLTDSDASADELGLDYPSAISQTKRQKKNETTRQPDRTAPIEVQSQQVLIGITSGRRPPPASGRGRKAVFNPDQNSYTFIASKEPRSAREGRRLAREQRQLAVEE